MAARGRAGGVYDVDAVVKSVNFSRAYFSPSPKRKKSHEVAKQHVPPPPPKPDYDAHAAREEMEAKARIAEQRERRRQMLLRRQQRNADWMGYLQTPSMDDALESADYEGVVSILTTPPADERERLEAMIQAVSRGQNGGAAVAVSALQNTRVAFSGPDTATIVPCEMPVPLGPRELLIHVLAAGVSRTDLLQCSGQTSPPPGASEVLGLEVSGVVVASGSQTDRKSRSGYKRGDAVMALLSGGGYAAYVAVDERMVMRVPPRLSVIQAAGVPEAFVTARWWVGE